MVRKRWHRSRTPHLSHLPTPACSWYQLICWWRAARSCPHPSPGWLRRQTPSEARKNLTKRKSQQQEQLRNEQNKHGENPRTLAGDNNQSRNRTRPRTFNQFKEDANNTKCTNGDNIQDMNCQIMFPIRGIFKVQYGIGGYRYVQPKIVGKGVCVRLKAAQKGFTPSICFCTFPSLSSTFPFIFYFNSFPFLFSIAPLTMVSRCPTPGFLTGILFIPGILGIPSYVAVQCKHIIDKTRITTPPSNTCFSKSSSPIPSLMKCPRKKSWTWRS